MPISGLTDMNFPIWSKANEASLAIKCQISVTFNYFLGKESRNSQSLFVPASPAAHNPKYKSQTYPV
jgi:hypothetical protein